MALAQKISVSKCKKPSLISPKVQVIDRQHPDENLREIAGIIDLLDQRLRVIFGMKTTIILGQSDDKKILLTPDGGSLIIQHTDIDGT